MSTNYVFVIITVGCFFGKINKLELELELELVIYTEHLLATAIDRQWLRHVNVLLGRHSKWLVEIT